MSWFDATGIATLAKSALKEAQKTIDKALDINEEEQTEKWTKPTPSEEPPVEGDGPDSFFSTWGLAGEKEAGPSSSSKEKKSKKMTTSASLWGSFTGSFFENPQAEGVSEQGKSDLVSIQPKKSIPPRSLSLDLTNTSVPASKPLPSSPEPSETPPDKKDEVEAIREEIKNYPVEVVFRKKEPRNVGNRLSVISSESDRRSSDCDILGSTSTPDSDPSSISTSSSVAKLRQSGSFESIEVLTSPSSVDILTSPGEKQSSDSISPPGDGVEIIAESEDEVSVEDSYTSASENTVTVTILEHGGHHDPNVMLKSTSSLDTSFRESLPIRESSRAVAQRVEKETSSTKSSDSQTDLSKSSRLSESSTSTVIELPTNKSFSESIGSDNDPVAVDTSSCEEGTIMGSSGEGDSLRPRHQSQISHMLADAMEPAAVVIREQSPISSESRSDLVKIGSSEHTSGDELETTTSSDIEIISSPTPNGDSSSTASRQSPSKLAYKGLTLGKIINAKVKGHHREPSEGSSGGSDECCEIDKLLKRIAEMTEILEARESKLIDLSRMNAELQESNSDLKIQLERQNESQEIQTISEEFTRRMSALERKFQQAVSEKDLLRKQLDHAKSLAAKTEDDTDKDQLIVELRSEGEKLSKQQLTLNNAIKKLRATEKENTKTIAYLNEQLSDKSQELERIKKSVVAKEEMERSHIEAVHNLTKQNQNLEKEITTLKSNVSALTNTVVSTQKELSEKAEAYKALEERRSLEKKEVEKKILADISSDLEASEQQVLTLQSALEDMRRQLLSSQEQNSQKEKMLRKEISDLLRRAEAAEQRAEENAEAVTMASQPLARQMQTLTETHTAATAAWQRQEASLIRTISELEGRLGSVSAKEKKVREQYEKTTALCTTLQERNSSLQEESERLKKDLDGIKEKLAEAKELLKKSEKSKEEKVLKLEGELTDTRRELTACQELLSVERAALDAEKRKTAGLQERLRAARNQSPPFSSMSPRSSPTLSFGRVSVSESVSSWPVPFGDDDGSISGRIYEALRPCNNSSFMETLQSQLKLKEGEVQQLQWELARRDLERNQLNNEVSELTTRVEAQEAELKELTLIKTQYNELLQMYGEKVEESEELRMDLQDIKDMYKAQIDELLKKDPSPPPAPPPS